MRSANSPLAAPSKKSSHDDSAVTELATIVTSYNAAVTCAVPRPVCAPRAAVMLAVPSLMLLSMPVLLKVVRAMSPRKMSPILAAMSAEPAQKLTTALAATENTDVVADVGENLAQLPQIVGQ